MASLVIFSFFIALAFTLFVPSPNLSLPARPHKLSPRSTGCPDLVPGKGSTPGKVCDLALKNFPA